jgi:hypothetical protein
MGPTWIFGLGQISSSLTLRAAAAAELTAGPSSSYVGFCAHNGSPATTMEGMQRAKS